MGQSTPCALRTSSLSDFRQNSHCANLCSPFLIKMQMFLSHNHLKTYPIQTILVLQGGVLEPFPYTSPMLALGSPDGKHFLPHIDELSLKHMGKGALCLKDWTVQRFAGCILQCGSSFSEWCLECLLGWDGAPTQLTSFCCSWPLQPPPHLSLASALTVLGLAVTSPLCQTCRRAGE